MHNISVILPVKNGEKYLNRALEGITSCCNKYDQILIIDNGSQDGSGKIIENWAKQDSRINVLACPNGGLVDALNLALDRAQNDWIARFDVDDTYSSDRIEYQKALISDKTVAIFSDYQVIGERSENLGIIASPVFPAATSISLIASQRTAHPSVLYNRNAVIAVGGYRDTDFPAEDLALWLRLSRVGDLVSVPRILLKYQLSTSSVSSQKRNEMINKRKELISNIGICKDDFLRAKDSFDEILNGYSDLEFFMQRKIMFLIDYLHTLKNVSHLYSLGPCFPRALSKIVIKKDFYSELILLKSQSIERRKYRIAQLQTH